MTLVNKAWLNQEITRLFLSGESQESIAIQLNISVGTVSNIVNEMIKSDDTIELQRQIAIVAKKKGIKINEIASNLRYKNIIKQSALDDRKIEKFLDALDIWGNKYNIPPVRLANHLSSIIEITLRENIEPHRLEAAVTSKITELRETNQENATSKKMLEETKAIIEEEQRHLKINQKHLDQFRQVSMILDLYKLPEFAFEYGYVVRALIDIKNMGYDPKVIVSKYERFMSLTKANKKLEARLQEKEKALKDYKRKSDEEEGKWKDYGNSFETFTRLIKAGLKEKDIFTAVEILKNDYTQDKTNQLLEDIRTYGSISAAKSKLERELQDEDQYLD